MTLHEHFTGCKLQFVEKHWFYDRNVKKTMINDGIKNKEGGRECSMRKRRNLTDSSDCKKDQIYKVKVNKF